MATVESHRLDPKAHKPFADFCAMEIAGTSVGDHLRRQGRLEAVERAVNSLATSVVRRGAAINHRNEERKIANRLQKVEDELQSIATDMGGRLVMDMDLCRRAPRVAPPPPHSPGGPIPISPDKEIAALGQLVGFWRGYMKSKAEQETGARAQLGEVLTIQNPDDPRGYQHRTGPKDARRTAAKLAVFIEEMLRHCGANRKDAPATKACKWALAIMEAVGGAPAVSGKTEKGRMTYMSSAKSELRADDRAEVDHFIRHVFAKVGN